MKIIIVIFLCFHLISCYHKKAHSVLIIGNSITWHPPRPEVGWSGNWGMAASCADSDFVHILIKKIKAKDSTIKIDFINHADFESGFKHYDLSKFDSLKNRDLIIMRIGENVNDSSAKEFIVAYDNLLKYLDPLGKADKIITNSFFYKSNIENVLKIYADKNNLSFVKLDDLEQLRENKATQYFDGGVARHPSNKGMNEIANRIWNKIKDNF